MAKSEKQTENGKLKINGKTVQIVISSVGILLSLLLLFVPTITLEILCYVFCGMLITVGVLGILSFFVRGFSLQLQEYGFTGGVLLVLLGLIGILRTEQTTEGFLFFIGLGSLVLGIMILQGTLTLRAKSSRFWIANLVLTVLALGVNFVWFADIHSVRETFRGGFAYWAVLLTGLMSYASMILTWLGQKEAEQAKNAPAQEENKTGTADELLPEDAAVFTPVIQVSPSAPAAESGSYTDALNSINSDDSEDA